MTFLVLNRGSNLGVRDCAAEIPAVGVDRFVET